MRPIIHVRDLGKKYYLRARTPTTLREAFVEALGAAGRGLSRRGAAKRAPLWALRDVSFDIYPGEVVGVVGRNGAGKSTLLKILSRVVRPTTGAADIYGRVGSLLGVGTGFHPDLTGRENVFLNGAILGMRRGEVARKFDEIVSFAEVEQFLDTPVKHYSSGMYLRLAFAIAAHLEPEILLLDEVLAVGDHAFQKRCLGKMREVGREGRTVLFVSHNAAAVQQFCERALFIRAGALEEDGPPGAVLAGYLQDTSAASAGVFDLSRDRGRAVLRRLTLYGGGDSPTARFRSGERMVAEITIDPESRLGEPRIALGIEDGAGRRITTVASHFQRGPLGSIAAPCVVRCTLPRLALGGGHYFLSVMVEDKYAGLIDALDHAASFEVAWHDGYGNGEQYRPSYGPVITHSRWERLAQEGP